MVIPLDKDSAQLRSAGNDRDIVKQQMVCLTPTVAELITAHCNFCRDLGGCVPQAVGLQELN